MRQADGYFHTIPYDDTWYTVNDGRVSFTFTDTTPNLTLAEFHAAMAPQRFSDVMDRDAMRAVVKAGRDAA